MPTKFSSIVCFVIISCLSSVASAQGLLFHLPEDGTGVEYEGTIVQEYVRPDITDGSETIEKAREMSIKSVGREEAEFEGRRQPCRWIEIKVTTGTAGAAGIDPGPVGARVYKVLVPESKIISAPADADSVPNIVLPIVKGYRRSGEAQIRRMTTNALGIYPTICQLVNYPNPTVVAAQEAPPIKTGTVSVTAKHMKGSIQMERPESRSKNTADFWVTPDVPFGLAHWDVVVIQEKKESTAPRSDFKEVSTTKCVMSVRRILNNAESELVTPDE